MKKIYLILVLIVGLQTQAQFFEGFEGAVFPPPGWITANTGSGTDSWKLNRPPFPAYEGSNCAFIDRFNTPQSTAGYWLITPAITVAAHTPLTFFNRQSLIGDDATTLYQIRVSTTSQSDLSSFSVLDSWGETDLSSPALTYEQKVVSLDAYVGQTVYLAFVRITVQPTLVVSGDRWLVDNVTVGPTNVVGGLAQYSMNGLCDADSTTLFDHIPIDAQSAAGTDRVFTSAEGNYSYTSLNNTFTLAPNPNIGGYFTITPSSYTYNFATLGNAETANFCIAPNGVHPDLEITLLPRWNLAPGFTIWYDIVYKNKGNQLQSGTVTFHFDDAILEYTSPSSYPAVDAQSAGTLSWNFTDLKPFETRRIGGIALNLNTPTDIPAVNIGDVVNSSAAITTSQTDDTPNDNTSSLSQIVEASHDPNDKIVTEGSVIDIAKVDDYLHYIIRFQNIGTADALKVVVRDILTENLDPATFEMIASSHPCQTTLRNNKLEFAFDNINLPSSIVNEEASHGFVAFKIKPAATVGIGSVIENTASIYFDFNFPIITNTTSTTVATLATNLFDSSDFTIYPNPAQNSITVKADNTAVIQSIILYNLLGQMVNSVSSNTLSASTTIDLSALKAGTYFMEIQSSQGKTTKKFVKL
ncbi:choice-of-anchor J domain-containing protein [Flavobacterium sp.]|uniref:T9SS-dependent choice-of-anchor J family protein n=1 Tax=Flavobacterium sp. TaxID=239 RepID=UPI00262071B7|nr:choice-of-anchor J domain-containing protein [Flavobacterium sp.]